MENEYPKDAAVRTEAEWRDIVWKWVGVPEELWPQLELMGAIVFRACAYGDRLSSPKRSDFIIAVPRPSNPSKSVNINLSDDCHEWPLSLWKEYISGLIDYLRDSR